MQRTFSYGYAAKTAHQTSAGMTVSRCKLITVMPHLATDYPNPSVLQLRRLALLLVLPAFLLAACDSSPEDTLVDDVQQRLVGSWQREYDQEGAHVKRLLELNADGHFTETARVVEPDGAVTEHLHTGEWIFDGTNLKRKYLSADGKPLSRLTLPYATFALKFDSNREFVGTDNIRKREVRYQRVN